MLELTSYYNEIRQLVMELPIPLSCACPGQLGIITLQFAGITSGQEAAIRWRIEILCNTLSFKQCVSLPERSGTFIQLLKNKVVISVKNNSYTKIKNFLEEGFTETSPQTQPVSSRRPIGSIGVLSCSRSYVLRASVLPFIYSSPH